MKNVKNTYIPIKNTFENNFLNTKHAKKIFGRRGVVDVQFNWIFVLIAGFVIFLFIISIAFSQKHSAEKQADIATVNQITTLLKGRQQTPDMYSEITFPRSDIEFTCDRYYYKFDVRIANAQSTPLPVDIIFAPKLVNTNKLMIWSQPFNLGFPVSVFTFITTANSVILVYNDSDATDFDEELFNDLEYVSNITHKYITTGNEFSNYARRTIVCFKDHDSLDDTGCPDASYGYIKITPAEGLFDYGEVTFHKSGFNNNQDSINTYPYITKAGLYGAIFGNSPDYYYCQMTRALTQFEIKRQLTGSRLTMMQDTLPEGECKGKINVTLETEIALMQNPTLSPEDIKNLYTQSQDLAIRNTDLGLYNCPKIY